MSKIPKLDLGEIIKHGARVRHALGHASARWQSIRDFISSIGAMDIGDPVITGGGPTLDPIADRELILKLVKDGIAKSEWIDALAAFAEHPMASTDLRKALYRELIRLGSMSRITPKQMHARVVNLMMLCDFYRLMDEEGDNQQSAIIEVAKQHGIEIEVGAGKEIDWDKFEAVRRRLDRTRNYWKAAFKNIEALDAAGRLPGVDSVGTDAGDAPNRR